MPLSQSASVPSLLHCGKLNKGQVQAWALNRYYTRAPFRSRMPWYLALRDRGIRRENGGTD